MGHHRPADPRSLTPAAPANAAGTTIPEGRVATYDVPVGLARSPVPLTRSPARLAKPPVALATSPVPKAKPTDALATSLAQLASPSVHQTSSREGLASPRVDLRRWPPGLSRSDPVARR